MHEPSNNNPLLIVVRGMPGSGKSYLAIELRKALGDDDVVMLDPDAIDYDSAAYAAHVKAQIAEGVDASLYAYRFLRAQAYEAIAAGKTIIWNQPFTNLDVFTKMIGRLREQATAHSKQLFILIVEVEIDPATAKARVARRKQEGGHGPSDNTLARRINDYHSFAGEGYETVTVHGETDVLVSVSSVLEAIRHLER